MKDAWQFDRTEEVRWPDWLKGRAREIGTWAHPDGAKAVIIVPNIAFNDASGAEVVVRPSDIVVLGDDDSLHLETAAEATARAADHHAPTSVRIERMAKAAHAVHTNYNASLDWHGREEPEREKWRAIAKATLAAVKEP